MPRKIQNLLEEGLPSQIYFLCYLKSESGYSLGKIIYNIKKGIPPTAKLYPRINEMVKKGYLKKLDDGYSSDIKPIVNEIQKICSLNSTDSKKLTELLNSNEFKNYILGFYENFEKNIEIIYDENNITKLKQNFNAMKTILETVGMISTLFIIRGDYRNVKIEENVKDFKNKLKQSKSFKNSSIQKQVNSLKYFNAVLPYFRNLSFEAIDKLTKLWTPSSEVLSFEKHDFIEKTRGKK